MKKSLLCLALGALFAAQPLMAERWLPVTDINDCVGKQVALVWYYAGEFVNPGAPAAMKAPRNARLFEAKVRHCVTLGDYVSTGYNAYYNANLTCYGSSLAVDLDNIQVDVNGNPIAITGMPEGINLVEFVPTTGDKYAVQWVTGQDTPKYWGVSSLFMDRSSNYLGLSDDKQPNTININANGQASITAVTEQAQNVFSAFSNFGSNECIFQYVSQALNLGNLYVFMPETETAISKLVPDFTPANNWETRPTADGKQVISVSWGETVIAGLNSGVSITGTFGGQPLAAEDIVCSETSPVEITVSLPANTEGQLVLNIPAGLYNLTMGTEQGGNGAYTYTLDVKNPTASYSDMSYKFTPVSGVFQSSVEEIGIEFTGCTATLGDDPTFKATLDGDEQATPMMVDALNFKYRPALMGNGKYVLTFEEGFWTLTFPNGATLPSPEIKWTCSLLSHEVLDPSVWTCDPAPGSTVNKLKKLEFIFEGAEEVLLTKTTPAASDFVITFLDQVYTYGNGLMESQADEGEENIIYLTDGITGDGQAFISVAQGFWTVVMEDGDVLSPAMQFSIGVGNWVGVDGVESEQVFPIYNAAGVKVATGKLSDVSKGLYIINGKKVIVK